MKIYDELVARGLIAQVTMKKRYGRWWTAERPSFISDLTLRPTVCM